MGACTGNGNVFVESERAGRNGHIARARTEIRDRSGHVGSSNIPKYVPADEVDGFNLKLASKVTALNGVRECYCVCSAAMRIIGGSIGLLESTSKLV